MPSAQDSIVIGVMSDRAYLPGVAATVRSLLDHRTDPRPLSVIVFHDGLTLRERMRLRASWRAQKCCVAFLRPDLRPIGPDLPAGRWPRLMYLRLLLPRLLPRCSRLLFLDADLLVRRDVGELWDADLRGNPLGAVQDSFAPTVSAPKGLSCWRDLGIPPTAPHFNAGLLLIDLQHWRDRCLEDELLRTFRTYLPTFRWGDQCVFNAVFANRVTLLDPRWNSWAHLYHATPPAEIPYAPALFEELYHRPWILHYAAPIKPWQEGYFHPHREWFLESLRRTRFSDVPSTRGMPSFLLRFCHAAHHA